MNSELLRFINARFDAWPSGRIKLIDLRTNFFDSLDEHTRKAWTPARLVDELQSAGFVVGVDDRAVQHVGGLIERNAQWVNKRGRLILDVQAKTALRTLRRANV
jgi:hypothetical protein